MRNKYNYNELVKVNGIGKELGKVENKLGFIIRKDDFYDDYYIELIFGDMTIIARIIYTLVGIAGLWGIKLAVED